MLSIILGSVTLVTSMMANASPIFGYIQIAEDGMHLRQETGTYEIQSANVDVSSGLARLRSGDFIAFEGQLSPGKKIAVIQSIDWVGLQRLLGYWRTSDRKLIEFASFTSLKFYSGNPTDVFYRPNRRTPRYESEVQTLSYRVAPSVGSSWSIFLSNQGQAKFGRLVLVDNSMTISFFDGNTGKITKTITLQKTVANRNAHY